MLQHFPDDVYISVVKEIVQSAWVKLLKSWCCCNFVLYSVIYHWTFYQVLCTYYYVKTSTVMVCVR